MIQFGGSNREDASLEEALLDDSNSPTRKTRGCNTVTPYANNDSSVFKILSFSWLAPLFALAKEKTLDLDDIPQLNIANRIFGAFPIFHSALESDSLAGSRVTKFGLVRGLFLSAWKETLWTGFLALLDTCASYVGPFLIDSFVLSLNGRGKFKRHGYILALIFCVASFVEGLIRKHCIFKTQQIGFRTRASLTTMIYNKGLSLPSQSMQGQASGEFINVVAVDAERINDFIVYMHDSWLIIVQVGLALLILYKNLGFSSVAALAAAICIMLTNTLFGTLQNKFQKNLMESKDNRMKVTMETLRNIRILKLQGWEMNFLTKILQLREVETIWLKKYLYNSAMMSFVLGISPTFVALATFGSCILMGIPLDAGKILSALATFRVLQAPIYNLPDTISLLVQTNISLERIASFLSLDELQDDVVEKLPLGSSDKAVEVIDGNFSWDNMSTLPIATLKGINLSVSHGMKVAVCGSVGSGKSSLLSCILGEITKMSGAVKLCGTKAYVAQSPWIQSGTIQENILFGNKMDLQRYEKVLEACCLKKDLQVLPFGDQTVIGERGINLSGGQKQRIQIARALYRDADIYLFDDPFSSLDAHTGSYLFKEVLLSLLSGKTIVYVTHQVEFLSSADIIVVMKDGTITQIGKYCDILDKGSDFMELVGAQSAALSTLDSNLVTPLSECERTKHVKSGGGNEDMQNGEEGEGAQQLIQEEERERGSVGLLVYRKYLTTTYGGALVVIILLASILMQILQIGSNYWLAVATTLSNDGLPHVVSGATLIIVYISLAIGISSCILAVHVLVATTVYKTATILFTKMHQCIFHAPMSFFDATPSGRILNRCSTDQNAIETRIPSLAEEVVSSAIQILGIIALMAAVAWQLLIIFILVILASIWYQRYYMSLATDLSRLARVSEAPVIQHFAETLSGTTTIRSFNQQLRLKASYMEVVDTYSRPDFHLAAALKWLLLRLDLLSSVTFAVLLALLVFFENGIDHAIAGLAVTYGFTLNNELVGWIRCLCNCETKMISVERMFQYMSIPSEAPLIIAANKPHHSWPSRGEIGIDNLQVRYGPHMPLVLHNITCTFQGGMKTSIVGRTGSGKSTLIQALFRIVEPSAGIILIDGIDISMIGLHDLRSRLSIIPQDPTMFQGTIRSNLDPLEEYTDEQIWETLDKCQLGDEVRKMDQKLDSYVTENGDNWSVGQRQLVCLGRVLLKKSKVLVLDEATASVDTATDNLIQQTLKQHFSDCTVITVAHRITSVIDSDMVLVLSHGLIDEYDSPTKLLRRKSSSFAQLVAEYMARSNSTLETST